MQKSTDPLTPKGSPPARSLEKDVVDHPNRNMLLTPSLNPSQSKEKPAESPVPEIPLKEHWYPDINAQRRTSPFRSLPLDWWTAFIIVAFASTLAYLLRSSGIKETTLDFLAKTVESPLLLATCGMIVIVIGCILTKIEKPVYLVDFTVTLPTDEFMTTRNHFIGLTKARGDFTDDMCAFQERVIRRSGIGDQTYIPKGVLTQPPISTMEYANEECKFCFTNAFEQLFARTGLKPKDIDILIVTCSLFNPTPSISSMIANHYKLRSDCKTFNLGGMGCSAGLVGIDLAQRLLKNASKGTKCVVFSHENLTLNWYLGSNKGMLLPNLLFRLNGAAILLTNEYNLSHKPKYKLTQTVRIYESSEQAHHAVFQEEDAEGRIGVILARDLVDHVTKGLNKNLYFVGLKNLPLIEKLKFGIDSLRKKLSEQYKKSHGPYIPNFSSVFKHYCIHCGGRAIIDGLQKNLSLTDEECEPSRAALYRFGNTSSASLWYELNYIELAGKQKAGDKILQLTFGSGLKVNSAVWETL